ncbi:MAG: glycosyltransferase [Planctomycetes bacterium]|nr:glycosyltransferase [Planctomycetota bacterium]
MTTTAETTKKPQVAAPRIEALPRELDVSIIVPIALQDAEVDDVVKALGGELDRAGKTWECILVFDAVRGPAYHAAQALAAARGEQIKLISFKAPFGESMCLSAGVERALGRVILTSPPYVQVDPVEIRAMLAKIDEGADFVTPWRKPRIDPWPNRMQSAFFNWVIRQIIQAEFHDLNCYLRAIRREVFDDLAVYGDMYRFLPVIAHRKGFHVVEVPVRHLREWGKTGIYGVGVYVRRFLDVLGVMFLTKFTHKPLRFFGSVGALTLGIGGLIMAVILYQRLFLGAALYGRPIFVIAVLLLVLGIQIIGFGLLGEIIIYTQARNLRGYRIDRIYDDGDEPPDSSSGSSVSSGAK